MLRHNHVTQEQEILLAAHLVEDSYKAIPALCCPQKRPPPVTTKGHKMEIVPAVVPLQRVAHGRKSRTLENHKGAAPGCRSYKG